MPIFPLSSLTHLAMFAFLLVAPKSCTFECVEGSKVSDVRVFETEDFHSVRLSGSFDMVVTQAETHKVWARGDDNILAYLNITNESGFLKVSLNPGCFLMYDLVVFVETPTLSRAMVSGSGDIAIGGFQGQRYPNLAFDEISARIQGSGNIIFKNMEGVDVYDVIVNGSGDVEFISPLAQSKLLSVQIHGSGEVDAQSLESARVKIGINGSGDVQAHALDQLEIEINGSGDVRYAGDPANVMTDVNGSGSISKL
jgi:hypothetical protein